MCPISNVIIDRNVVRTNGLITTGLLLLYVLTGSPLIIVPIGLDYVLRARMHGPTSPMAHLAAFVAKTLGFSYVATDKAPKVFASRIGVCFAMGSAITWFFAPTVSIALAGTLAIFTALESIGDFCVGCHVYSYIVLPLYRARDAATSIPMFRGMSDGMLIAIANGFQTEKVAQGTRLITEGEAAAEMYMICSGRVEVYHEGAPAFTTYEKGQVVGEMALLSGEPRNANVRAVTPLLVLKLLKADFEAMLAKHPDMRSVLQNTAAERIEAARAAATSWTSNTTRSKDRPG